MIRLKDGVTTGPHSLGDFITQAQQKWGIPASHSSANSKVPATYSGASSCKRFTRSKLLCNGSQRT